MPTSRRAPTCGRGSPGWRVATARRARRCSTARGSNGGDAVRLGPSSARPIKRGGRERRDRRHDDRHMPVDAAQGVEQMRQRGSERERADEDADHQAHVAFRPRRRELHADRIDTRQRHAGCESQHRRNRGGGVHQQQERVGDRACEGAQREQPARVDAVGQAEHRADEASRHEAQLHAARERGLHETGQVGTREPRRARPPTPRTTAPSPRPGRSR